eukprot:m.527786 g.527786  ORF g.527786 m.527786 type:complete len:119 (+) comp22013_c0_seq23:1635-1991(+)
MRAYLTRLIASEDLGDQQQPAHTLLQQIESNWMEVNESRLTTNLTLNTSIKIVTTFIRSDLYVTDNPVLRDNLHGLLCMQCSDGAYQREARCQGQPPVVGQVSGAGCHRKFIRLRGCA